MCCTGLSVLHVLYWAECTPFCWAAYLHMSSLANFIECNHTNSLENTAEGEQWNPRDLTEMFIFIKLMSS